MALGTPVVVYVQPSMLAHHPPEIPIVNATVDNIAEVLESLIQDGQRRYELGVRSREYVQKYHDADVLARELLDIYGQILAAPRPGKHSDRQRT
jgi:hypothetical protein